MPIDDIVKVTTVATGSTPTAENFDTPIIFAYHEKNTDLVRSYVDETGMVADGYNDTDVAFMVARAVFSQNPRPERVKIGRRSQAWTQVIELTPQAPSVGMVYSLEVNGVSVSVTAVADDDLADICTALATAIQNAAADADPDAIAAGTSTNALQTLNGATLNGVVGGKRMSPPRALRLTVSAHADWNATTVTVTGVKENGQIGTQEFAIPDGGGTTLNGTVLFRSVTSTAIPAQGGSGGTFTLGTKARLTADGSDGEKVVVTAADVAQLQTYAKLSSTLSLFDATEDPGLEADIAAVYAADSDWYGVLLDSNSKAEIDVASDWTESNKRLFVAHTSDTACKSAQSTTDVMAERQAASMFRTTLIYHPTVGKFFLAAAWLGERFPDKPGTDTWAHKELAGVEVYSLSDSERQAILAKNGNVYLRIQGLNRTYGGRSGGGKTSGGEWIDKVRGIDALASDIQLGSYNVLANARGKIPYTDKGASIVAGAVRDSLDRFTSTDDEPRLLADDPPPIVTVPKVRKVSATNKNIRNLPDVKWKAYVAGAIHAVEIEGAVLT